MKKKKSPSQSHAKGNGNGNGNGNGHGNGNNGNGHGSNGDDKADKAAEQARVLAAVRSKLCALYTDVRLFGAVMSGGKKEGGWNGGSFTGPVQFEISASVNIPHVTEYGITRVAIANEALSESRDANQTMGNKFVADYVLFNTQAHVDPYLADKTCMTYLDLRRLVGDSVNMFNNDVSAARPSMRVRKVVVFKHKSKLGDCPPYVLEKLINIQQTTADPQRYEDFDITIAPSPTPDVETFVFEPWPAPDASIDRMMAGLAENAVVANRWDMAVIWEAIRSNPNGDPDNANHPRVNAATHRCEVTDMCLKRKIRDRLVMIHGLEIYVRRGSVLSLNRKRAYDELGLNAPPPPPIDDDADDDDEAGDDAVS